MTALHISAREDQTLAVGYFRRTGGYDPLLTDARNTADDAAELIRLAADGYDKVVLKDNVDPGIEAAFIAAGWQKHGRYLYPGAE